MNIPKSIIQTSFETPSECYISNLTQYANDYTYKCFNDDEILSFLTENSTESFVSPINIYQNLQNEIHKAQFFRFYYLYLYGGIYVATDIVVNNLFNSTLVKDSEVDFYTIESSFIENTIYDGVIGTTPKHPVLYKIISYIYEHFATMHVNDNSLCSQMFTLISECEANETVLLHETKLSNTRIMIKYKEENVCMHYIGVETKLIYEPSFYPIPERLTIGVTISMGHDANNIYNSGVQQHALFFAEMLLNMNYNVYLLLYEIPDNLSEILYDKRFHFIHSLELPNYKFHVVFTLGSGINSDDALWLKSNGTKLVHYECGNAIFLECEAFCHSQRGIPKREKYLDEIWCIPQMHFLNKCYLETLHSCPVKLVPFLWSEKLINKEEWIYAPNDELKNRIAICEPNISIMKCAIPPLVICENAYRKKNTLIKYLLQM